MLEQLTLYTKKVNYDYNYTFWWGFSSHTHYQGVHYVMRNSAVRVSYPLSSPVHLLTVEITWGCLTRDMTYLQTFLPADP